VLTGTACFAFWASAGGSYIAPLLADLLREKLFTFLRCEGKLFAE
jgi:hypothetical protein